MKIILYGGSGFIGINLARFFSKNSNHIVLIVSRSQITSNLPKNVEYADWNEFNSNIESYIKDFDYFFYMVNTILPREKSDNLSLDMSNEKTRINLIFNAAVTDNLKLKFLYFSSGGAVYGNHSNKPYREFDALKPVSSYGKLKLCGEKEVLKLSKKYLIESIILRPSNVYGVGQSVSGKQGVISFFTDQIIKKLPLTVFGNGQGLKDYIYIDDFINAINELILNNAFGIFNIGSGYTASVNEIIELIEKKIGMKSTRTSILLSSPDITDFSLDCSHLKEVTGFSCKYSLQKGINHYIESLHYDL